MKKELFEALAKYEKITVEQAEIAYEEGAFSAEEILKAWLRKKLLLRYEKQLWTICEMAKREERERLKFYIDRLFEKEQ